MEMPYGRSEEDALPDIEKKSPAVGQVRLHLECRGEAVDEGPLVQQGRPVIKEPGRSGLPSHSLPARTGRRDRNTFLPLSERNGKRQPASAVNCSLGTAVSL